MNPTLLKLITDNGTIIIKAIIAKGGLSALLATLLLIVVGYMVSDRISSVEAVNKDQAKDIKQLNHQCDSVKSSYTTQLQRLSDECEDKIEKCRADAEKYRSMYEASINK